MKLIEGKKGLFLGLSTALIFLPGFAFADRCDPEMLNKLPEKKRAMIEKKCDENKKKSAFVISNLKTIDTEARPEDKYTGSDQKTLEKMVRDAWSKKYPDDYIMGIHFYSDEWKTTKNKTWNSAINSWQFTDVSVLPVKVVIKTDPKVATIFPAFINKDNMDNSINAGVATKSREYVVRQMLVSNY